MNITKNIIVLTIILVASVVFIGFYVWTSDVLRMSDAVNSPEPSVSPETSPSPSSSPKPVVTKAPLPTGDGRTSFVGESVPWSLLLADASCELKGELKFFNHNTYDNQNAIFIYRGIDSPARNIFWTITPQDNISVGPNIINYMPIPNGESLLGVVLPENPKSKTYDITAKIQYGRLVDANGKFVATDGTVKLFEKQCEGKTTIVLP